MKKSLTLSDKTPISFGKSKEVERRRTNIHDTVTTNLRFSLLKYSEVSAFAAAAAAALPLLLLLLLLKYLSCAAVSCKGRHCCVHLVAPPQFVDPLRHS